MPVPLQQNRKCTQRQRRYPRCRQEIGKGRLGAFPPYGCLGIDLRHRQDGYYLRHAGENPGNRLPRHNPLSVLARPEARHIGKKAILAQRARYTGRENDEHQEGKIDARSDGAEEDGRKRQEGEGADVQEERADDAVRV